MKKYEYPELELIKFSVEDVIQASDGGEEVTEDDTPIG